MINSIPGCDEAVYRSRNPITPNQQHRPKPKPVLEVAHRGIVKIEPKPFPRLMSGRLQHHGPCFGVGSFVPNQIKN
jgi:hypothetical protein